MFSRCTEPTAPKGKSPSVMIFIASGNCSTNGYVIGSTGPNCWPVASVYACSRSGSTRTFSRRYRLSGSGVSGRTGPDLPITGSIAVTAFEYTSSVLGGPSSVIVLLIRPPGIPGRRREPRCR
ncbi:Uncharacterised protein [Mycobacteroides abscessus subsp. abscessus]|nr:Uncharacterised protein [Mycobacteroides abscessus subsp. abscessus]